MRAFNAEEGILHFVFAEQKDHYVLPSLLHLNFTSYLYYQLKQAGFAIVLFISRNNSGSFSVRFADPASFAFLSKKGFFSRLFGADDIENAGVRNMSADKVIQLMLRGENAAFVIDADLFDDLFGGGGEIEELLGRTGYGSIVVLTFGMDAEKNIEILGGEETVFRRFPDVAGAFSESSADGENCFRKLRRNLGDRCIFMNQFSAESVKNQVRYALWKSTGQTDVSEQQVERLSVFIAAWYHSAPFREIYRAPLDPENRHRRFDILERNIADNQAALLKCAERCRIEGAGAALKEDQYLFADTSLTRLFGEIQISETFLQAEPEACAKWKEIGSKLETPLMMWEHGPTAAKVQELLKAAERAVKDADAITFRKVSDALDFLLLQNPAALDFDNSGSETKETKKWREIWLGYQRILEISTACFSMRQKEKAQEAEIQSVHREFLEKKKDVQTILREKHLSVDDLTEENLRRPGYLMIAVALNECTELKKKENTQKLFLSNLKRNRISYEGSIQNLEAGLRMVTAFGHADLDAALRESQMMIERYASGKQETSDVAEEQERTLDSLLGGKWYGRNRSFAREARAILSEEDTDPPENVTDDGETLWN